MNIPQAQQEIQRLWGLTQAHQMTSQAFAQAVTQLQIMDDSGVYWHVDGATLKWYRYSGQAWVEQAPPVVPSAPAPLPPAPPPPLPGPGRLESDGRSRLPLWIGLGIAGLLVLVAAVLLLSSAFQPGPTTTLPTLTQAPAAAATTVAQSPLPAATKTIPPKAATATQPAATAVPTLSQGLVSPTPSTPTKPSGQAPADFLSPQGPWLLSRDADNIYLIQAKRTDAINSDKVVAPASLANMIAPKGGHLAFITSTDPDGVRALKLNIYNLASRQVEKVIDLTTSKTEPGSTAYPGDPAFEAVRAITEYTSLAWSADGRVLAFIGVLDGPSSDLYSYNLDTQKITHLTDGPSQAYAPSFSPDGKYIVQFGVTGFGTGAGHVMAGAWAAHADNSGVISLYEPQGGGESVLGWLDGNTVLVYGWNVVCGSYNLRSVSIQPLKITTLLPGCFTNIAFDPISHVIALTINQITSEGPGQNPSGLYQLRLDTGLQRFSPGDFNQVALPQNTAVTWGSASGQGAMAFTPTGAQVILPPGSPQDFPRAAPDGQVWALAAGQIDKTPGLWIGPPGGDDQKVFNDVVAAAAWNSRGPTLAFMSDDQLYFAAAPTYQPVLYGGTFPASEVIWVSP